MLLAVQYLQYLLERALVVNFRCWLELAAAAAGCYLELAAAAAGCLLELAAAAAGC